MDIVKVAKRLVSPGCYPFPTSNFLVRLVLATAVLWQLWLAPVAAFLNDHSRFDQDILIDFAAAAIIMALGGALASLASLAIAEIVLR